MFHAWIRRRWSWFLGTTAINSCCSDIRLWFDIHRGDERIGLRDGTIDPCQEFEIIWKIGFLKLDSYVDFCSRSIHSSLFIFRFVPHHFRIATDPRRLGARLHRNSIQQNLPRANATSRGWLLSGWQGIILYSPFFRGWNFKPHSTTPRTQSHLWRSWQYALSLFRSSTKLGCVFLSDLCLHT